MKKIGFYVEGMKCGSCSKKINEALAHNSLITKVDINLDEKSVILECDEGISAIEVKNSIEELGFTIPKSLRV